MESVETQAMVSLIASLRGAKRRGNLIAVRSGAEIVLMFLFNQ
jgi:hypothetical protein